MQERLLRIKTSTRDIYSLDSKIIDKYLWKYVLEQVKKEWKI